MFERDFRVPLKLVLSQPGDDCENEGTNSIDEFVQCISECLKRDYSLTRENLQKAAKIQKLNYDRKSRPRKFELGQSVWLWSPQFVCLCCHGFLSMCKQSWYK